MNLREKTRLTPARKLTFCLGLLVFGIVILVVSSISNTSGSLMQDLLERGQKANATYTATRTHGGHSDLTYTFEVKGVKYTYEEAFQPGEQDRFPAKNIVVTYLPEDPAKVERVLWRGHAQQGPQPVAYIMMAIAALLLVVTLMRAPANRARDRREKEELNRLRTVPLDDSGQYVFDYRKPWILLLGLLMIVIPLIPLLAMTRRVMSGGSIKFEGNMLASPEAWAFLVFTCAIVSPLILVGSAAVMAFFRERIVWGERELIWIDRLGREKVRASRSEIIEVRRTRLSSDAHRVSIITNLGEIRFLDSMPWAESLEILASRAADENRQASRPPAI